MDKFSYAIGLGIGQNLLSMGAQSINVEDFAQAIKDVLDRKETAISHNEAREIVNKYFEELETKLNAENIEKGKSFLKEERSKRMKSIREMGVFHKKYPINKTYLNIINSFMKYDFSGLVSLNGDNFDKIVNGKRNVLCVFFKKDCETCEEFKKEYISLIIMR